MAVLSSNCTVIGFLIRINCFAASCSIIPADCTKNTKGLALPSIIGISEAETSTNRLSIPNPARADIKCSMVDTRTSPLTSVVDNAVSPTFSGLAAMLTIGSRSVRRKTMPESGSAGCKVKYTFSPVWSPTPVALMVFLIERCLIMSVPNSRAAMVPDKPLITKIFEI